MALLQMHKQRKLGIAVLVVAAVVTAELLLQRRSSKYIRSSVSERTYDGAQAKSPSKRLETEARGINYVSSKSIELQPWLACPAATFFQKDYCTIYDMRNSNPECKFNNIPCVRVNKTRLPHFTVCTHSPTFDKWVSRHLHKLGIWELNLTMQVTEALRSNESLGFLDFGANIGQYTQLAAALGRKVLAIEPVLSNMQRIHRAARYNQFEHLITIVTNPVSNVRREVDMALVPDNMGGSKIGGSSSDLTQLVMAKDKRKTILADDLLSVMPFTAAVMKVDIEGEEIAAFEHSQLLLDAVRIPYIFMEWSDWTSHHKDVEHLINVLRTRAYQPRAHIHAAVLDYHNMRHWPGNIVWTQN